MNKQYDFLRQQLIQLACKELMGEKPEMKLVFLNDVPRTLSTFARQGVFSVEDVEYKFVNGQKYCIVHINNLDVFNPDITNKYAQADKALEQAKRKYVYSKYENEMISSKFGHIYNELRPELEVPVEPSYEKVSLEDSCTFELFIQSEGYDTFEDWQNDNKTRDALDIAEENHKLFLLERCYSQDYADGKAVEIPVEDKQLAKIQ